MHHIIYKVPYREKLSRDKIFMNFMANTYFLRENTIDLVNKTWSNGE